MFLHNLLDVLVQIANRMGLRKKYSNAEPKEIVSVPALQVLKVGAELATGS
jgi:hypothetical protein